MFARADTSAAFEADAFDVCIIGAGPAGLTACSELVDRGLRICVIESGAMARSPFAEGLKIVESERVNIGIDAQERVIGGTSLTWSGLCAPLDPIDFEGRPGAHHGGWPFGREALDPYYDEAAKRYGFPSRHAFTEPQPVLADANSPHICWNDCVEKLFLKPSPTYRFGTELQAKLAAAPNVMIYTHATVLRLRATQADAAGACVTGAVCKTPAGVEFIVSARKYVLAVGALEAPRILLNSTDTCPHGLGNEHDQVGRFLMNHPKGNSGVLRFTSRAPPLGAYGWRSYDEGTGYYGIRLSEGVQRRTGLLNCYVRLYPISPWSKAKHLDALRAIAAEVKAGHWLSAVPTIPGRVARARSFLADLAALRWGSLSSSFLQLALQTPILFGYFVARTLGIGFKAEIGFSNYLEMQPLPENRVVLGDTLDAHGVRRPRVTHSPSAHDIESLRQLQEVIARELSGQGWSCQLQTSAATLTAEVTEDACHYLGTTRMGTAAATSVVDPNLRVHSVVNLYILGGAVFPTSGCANPTMTIVALAIRLASRLAEDIVRRRG